MTERGCNQSVSQSVQLLSWVQLFATPAYGWASLIARLVKNLRFLGWEDPLEKGRLPTPVFLGFPRGSAGKESACNAGDLGWEGPLEKGKATHCSILVWRIPWTA